MKNTYGRFPAWLACALLAALLAGCSVGEVKEKVNNVSNAVGKEIKVVKRDVGKLIPHPDKDLAVAGYRLETYEGGKKLVVGTLQNKSNRQYSQVEISFNLYDNSGALVGNTRAAVANLDPHGTWKFDAPVTVKREQVAQVKLKEITGS